MNDATDDFQNFYEDFMKSLEEGDEKMFRELLSEAKGEFEDLENAATNLLGAVRVWKGKLDVHAQVWGEG